MLPNTHRRGCCTRDARAAAQVHQRFDADVRSEWPERRQAPGPYVSSLGGGA
jgi:hypothetical protein